VVRVTSPIFPFWLPGHIFQAGEARDFKFGLQVDRNEYYHMHVKVPQYGDVLGASACKHGSLMSVRFYKFLRFIFGS